LPGRVAWFVFQRDTSAAAHARGSRVPGRRAPVDHAATASRCGSGIRRSYSVVRSTSPVMSTLRSTSNDGSAVRLPASPHARVPACVTPRARE
jgi:hypothetical protein